MTEINAAKRKALVHATKLKVRHSEYRPPNSRIPGHNFAIGLLQTLEARVEELREAFRQTGSKHNHFSVGKDAFVRLMKDAAIRGPKSILEDSWLANLSDDALENNLRSVFDGVASTGKSAITFEELLAYVIDCSMCGKVGRVEERVPEYDTSGCGILKNLDEITRARYCPELGKILTAGRTIGLVDGATMQTRSFSYAFDAKDRFPCVYDIDYVPHLNAALCVGTDMSVHLVGLDRGKLLFTIPTNETHQVCAFDRSTSLAIVSSRNGDIVTYKLAPHRLTETKYERATVIKHHSQSVLRILPLEKDGLVATGSADSSVYIHDVVTGDVLTQFVGHFSGGGVRTLCHMSHHNLMASCAYDTEPMVWMISSAATRSDAFTLTDVEQPHIGHVVDMCSVPNTPQLTSVDVHGLIKIWDVRTFKCVQSIRADKIVTGVVDTAMMKWHSVIWDESCNELCVVSRRRLQKLARRIPVKELEAVSTTTHTTQSHTTASDAAAYCDEYPVLCVAINPATQMILTCSEQKVRVWDAFTGRQEILFDRLVVGGVSPISCACVNDTGKCFFLGHRGGRLASHAFSTGVLIYKFIDDGNGAAEVLSLTYLSGTNAIAAVTWNGCRVYYDQVSYLDGTQSFYPDGSRSIEVRTVHWDPIFNILTAGERTGTVALWESRQGRFTPDSVRAIGTIDVGDAEVSAVQFLTGFSAVAAADNIGRLALFTTTPHPYANRKFAELLLKGREVVRLAFYPPRRLLYCADDKGAVFVIDVAAALGSVGISAAATSWEGMMNSVGRQGTAPRSVVELVPARSVRAHSDVITGLAWLPGSGILVTCSVDRHALAWTLGLEVRGSLDPVAPSGGYEAPFTRPVDTEYIHIPPPDERLWETEYSPERRGGGAGPDGSGDATKDKSEPNSAVTLTSAAKFDEEIRKAAIELESFFKAQTTSASKEAADALTQMDGDSLTDHSRRWHFEPVTKQVRETGLVSLTEHGGAIVVDAEAEGRPTTRDVYSVNSTGVDCHFLLTPQPDAHHFRRKKHVVDRSGPEATGNESGGIPFEVTRDFPLPPNARAERDFLLRQMKDKEEVLQQRALAAEKDNPYVTARVSGALIDVSASGFAPLPELIRAPTPHEMRMARHGADRHHSHQRGPSQNSQRRAGARTNSRGPPRSSAESAMRALLPHELIALRRLPKLQPAATVAVLRERRSHSTPPQEVPSQYKLVDEVDWAAPTPLSQPLAQEQDRRQHQRSGPPMSPSIVRHDLDNTAGGGEVGFMTFGVRSLADRLLTPASRGSSTFNGTFSSAASGGRPGAWAKRHAVDLDVFDMTAGVRVDGLSPRTFSPSSTLALTLH